MTNNTYLIQALEAYRIRTEGQFGQVTESVLQLTQDAAAEIRRLNAEVLALQKNNITLHPIDSFTRLSGVTFWNWAKVAKVAAESEGSVFRVQSMVVSKECVTFQWEYDHTS